MFGLYAEHLDLSNTTFKVLNVTVYQQYYNPIMQLINRTQIPLVTCTPQHFAFNQKISQAFTKFRLNQGLCPVLGQQFFLQGKTVSNIFSQFVIQVNRCNKTIDAACVSDAQYNLIQNAVSRFQISFPIVNTGVNPGDHEYKEIFLQDRNYIQFSSILGASAKGSLSQDTIESDNTIMPWKAVSSQKIIRMADPLTTSFYVVDQQPMATIQFRQSVFKTTFTRSFNKIDNYFSYIGGVIQFIVLLIFFGSKYNQTAYEVSISRNVFVDNENKEIPAHSFNFFSFLKMELKKILDLINVDPGWQKTKTFAQSCEEVSMQLDVAYLMRRLLFMDAAIAKLMQQHEIETILMRKKPSMEEVRHLRRMHYAPQLVQHEVQQRGEQVEQEINVSGKALKRSPELTKKQKSLDFWRDRSEPSFSHREEDIKHFAESMKKVAEQSKKGKLRSQKIIKQISPQTVEYLRVVQGKMNGSNTKLRSQSMQLLQNQAIQLQVKGSNVAAQVKGPLVQSKPSQGNST